MTEAQLIVEFLKLHKGKSSAQFHKDVFGITEEEHDLLIRKMFGG